MIELVNHGTRCVIDPAHGGRIASLTADGVELLVTEPTDDDPLSWGCYAMVPYAGRVRGAELGFDGRRYRLRQNSAPHSIHGTVFDASWRTDSVGDDEATLSTDLGPDWPFRGRVTAGFALRPDGIDLSLSLLALDAMPAQVGWHPWFNKPTRTRYGFSHRYHRDPDGITLPEPEAIGPDHPYRHLDDCFAGSTSPDRGIGLTIGGLDLTLRSDCEHWVVYDLPAHATCVEPQSGPPNGVNTAPEVLPAGGRLHRILTIDWTGHRK